MPDPFYVGDKATFPGIPDAGDKFIMIDIDAAERGVVYVITFAQLQALFSAWANLTGVPVNVTSLSGLTLAADKGLYATGAGTLTTFTLTGFGRSLGGLADLPALKSLLAYATVAQTGAYSDLTGTPTLGTAAALDAGSANGVASLDNSGKVPPAQLPAIAISEPFAVASQAAMLALTAERGDIAIRSDLNKCFVLSTDSPSTLADWLELKTPTDAVLSVAGRTGAITLTTADVGGLGTAATKDTGVAAGNVVLLEAGAKLPAIDGSQLTNLPGGSSIDWGNVAFVRSTGNNATAAVGNATKPYLTSQAAFAAGAGTLFYLDFVTDAINSAGGPINLKFASYSPVPPAIALESFGGAITVSVPTGPESVLFVSIDSRSNSDGSAAGAVTLRGVKCTGNVTLNGKDATAAAATGGGGGAGGIYDCEITGNLSLNGGAGAPSGDIGVPGGIGGPCGVLTMERSRVGGTVSMSAGVGGQGYPGDSDTNPGSTGGQGGAGCESTIRDSRVVGPIYCVAGPGGKGGDDGGVGSGTGGVGGTPGLLHFLNSVCDALLYADGASGGLQGFPNEASTGGDGGDGGTLDIDRSRIGGASAAAGPGGGVGATAGSFGTVTAKLSELDAATSTTSTTVSYRGVVEAGTWVDSV